MVDVKDAVQVVGFVFQGLGQQPIGLDADQLAVQVQGAGPYSLGTLNRPAIAGNAQAALFDFPLPFAPDDFRVNQHQGFVPFRQLNHRYLLQPAHLVGGQAHAMLGVHSFHHVRGVLLHTGRNLRKATGLLAQNRVGYVPHGQKSQGGIPPGFRSARPRTGGKAPDSAHNYSQANGKVQSRQPGVAVF